jgi:hypothetical protein
VISVVVLVVVVALGYLALRRSRTAPGSRAELAYRLASPLPAMLVLVLPGLLTMIGGPYAGDLRDWLLLSGLWLSLAMLPVGLVIVWIGWRRGSGLDGALLAALFLALLPALMVALVAAFWRLGS